MFVDDDVIRNLIERYVDAKNQYKDDPTPEKWVKLFELKRLCILAGIPT